MSNEITEVSAGQAEAGKLLTQAKAHEVTTPELADAMTALIEYADAKFKTLEEARKSLTGPLNKQVRFINDQFREAKNAYEAASKEGRAKLKPWLEKLAREEREREEAERKAAEEAARKAVEEAERKAAEAADPEPAPNSPEDLGMGAPPPPPPAPPEPPEPPPAPPAAKPKGQKKKASTRKVKKWRITDMSKIPQKYFALDSKLVDTAMKDGEFIPGIEFYEDSEVVMR